MENIQLILTIAIPIYSLIVILLGVWLGHKLTMKAFSHVQPSTKDMAKAMREGTVTTEEDPFDKAYEEPPYEMSADEEGNLKKLFKEAGIPDAIFESYQKSGRSPQEFLGYDVPYADSGVEEELEKEEDDGDKDTLQ